MMIGRVFRGGIRVAVVARTVRRVRTIYRRALCGEYFRDE